MVLRGLPHLGMHLRVRDPRRSHVAPSTHYKAISRRQSSHPRFDSSRRQDARLLALPVAVFLGGPLVVLLLSFRQTDFELRPASLPVHGGRYQGVSGALDQTEESIDLFPMQQQLPCPRGVRMDVGGGSGKRGDMGAKQHGLAFLDYDVALLQLEASGAEALGLPTFEGYSRFDPLLDEIIVARFLVQSDRRAAASLCFCFLFDHGPRSFRRSRDSVDP